MSSEKKTKGSARIATFTMCRIALFSALFLVLKFVGIEAGTLKINFATLPVVISALMFGAPEAMLVAAIGEFITQLMTYGFMYSTVFWLVSPVVRALLIGLWAHFFFRLPAGKSGKKWYKAVGPVKIVVCYIVCLAAAVIATLVNTFFIAVDGKIAGYYSEAYVFGNLAVRLVTGILTAAAVTTAAIPIAIALKSALPPELTTYGTKTEKI